VNQNGGKAGLPSPKNGTGHTRHARFSVARLAFNKQNDTVVDVIFLFLKSLHDCNSALLRLRHVHRNFKSCYAQYTVQ
jgi:hypothetical protein